MFAQRYSRHPTSAAKSLTYRTCWLRLEIAQFFHRCCLIECGTLSRSVPGACRQVRRRNCASSRQSQQGGSSTLACWPCESRPAKCFEPMAFRPVYFLTRGIDVMPRIRLFGKLKLRNCARAGNRAGLSLEAIGAIRTAGETIGGAPGGHSRPGRPRGPRPTSFIRIRYSHAKFPCDCIPLLFTMSRLDFAGEFRRARSRTMAVRHRANESALDQPRC